jgi:hypothetical protein
MQINCKVIDTEAISLLNKAKEAMVVARTTNRIGTMARSWLRTYISQTYYLKKKEVYIGARKANRNRLTYTMSASPFFLRPSTFPFKQTGSGVDVKVSRQGSSLQLPGYFVAQPSGKDWSRFGQSKRVTATHPFLFKRQRSSGRYSGYPLERDKAREATMSPGAVMSASNTIQTITRMVVNEGPRIFDSELTYALTGKRKLSTVGQ